MEQGKSYSEEKASCVEETKEPGDDCNKIKSFAHEEMPSDHSKDKEDDLKRSRKSNVFKNAYSRPPKRKFDDKETTPSSSCHQITPEVECLLETNGRIMPTQEASNNIIELSIEQDTQAPTRKERQADRFKSEDELDTIPTINAFTNDCQNANEPPEPTLVEFKIDQAVEKCLQVLIDKVVYDHETEIGILLSLQEFHQSKDQKQSKKPKKATKFPLLTLLLQSNLENSSSQEIVKIQPGKKPELPSATKKPLVKCQRKKKVQKEYRMLLSVLEEVERMNDYYKKDIIKTNRIAREIQRLALHMYENLEVISSVTPCTITINNEGEPCHELNVFEHGSEIFQSILQLQLKTKTFLDEYNIFRLKFHESSIFFVSTPLDQIIGIRQKGALDEALEMSRCIYRDFFDNEEFDIHFETINEAHKLLEIQVEQFNKYVDILAK